MLFAGLVKIGIRCMSILQQGQARKQDRMRKNSSINLVRRGGKIEDKDLYEALLLNSRKKNTELEIQVDDDESVDMSECSSTPISKTKSISKNYAVRNQNYRKTRLKVFYYNCNINISHLMSLIAWEHYLHQL